MSDKDFEIDFGRPERTGFPEVVYGKSKSIVQLKNILENFQKRDGNCLVTKLQEDKAAEIVKYFPDSFYDATAQVLFLKLDESNLKADDIVIVSGGTSDSYVVNEAYYTLVYLGIKATKIEDVGVGGLHRLLNRLEEIRKHKIVITVAGFEAALPTVLAGLIKQPVIGVPTSIGYGVATGGNSALNSLLSSCANGLTVVNIDNGYGAAIAAYRIFQMLNT